MLKLSKKILIGILALFAVANCFVIDAIAAENTPPTLDQLLAIQPKTSDDPLKIDSMRAEALRGTALAVGTQAGLAFKYAENMRRLESISLYMDKTYPFQALMLEGNVVPPVIVEVTEVYDQISSSKLRLADRERTILTPPRFAYNPPSWRDYFFHNFKYDPTATTNIIPETPEEKNVWTKALTEGYRLGEEQANKILNDDTARLARDLNGMRLYHQLLIAGKVTKPYVAVVHTGVTGDKKSTMKEGESYLQISATPEFVMNSSDWDVPLSASIQERLKVLADPVKGAKLVEKAAVATEIESLSESENNSRSLKSKKQKN